MSTAKTQQNKMNKKFISAVLAIVILLSAAVLMLDLRLKTVYYSVENSKNSATARIVFISDLHCCSYGEDQEKIIEAVRAQNPDTVLFGGDMFDHKLDPEPTLTVMKALSSEYRCYYAMGNHENGRNDKNSLLKTVEELGITVLSGDFAEIKEGIALIGISDPTSYGDYSQSGSERMSLAMEHLESVKKSDEDFSVLLFHRPENPKEYASLGFDLVLSGHAHGGQWRIPGILNGLYAPHQGLFPEYAGGFYKIENTVMIVSRGLAKESNAVPRIFNRPEIVVIDIT